MGTTDMFLPLEQRVPAAFSFLPPFKMGALEDADEVWELPATAIHLATLSPLTLRFALTWGGQGQTGCYLLPGPDGKLLGALPSQEPGVIPGLIPQKADAT